LQLYKISSEKPLVKSRPDGSGILLWSGSGARDIADSRTKSLLELACVLLKYIFKESNGF
jgi:hypothetical protein